MARILFTSALQRFLAAPAAEADGATVRAVLDIVFAANPVLRGYVLDDQGALRRHVNIFVNATAVADRTGLSDPVAAEDEVFVFQALSGG
jgi:molybdopterin converting factor small subunit